MKAQFPGEQSKAGEFERQEDAFRKWITQDGSSGYPAVPGRYHLYVSLACPWASRTVIVRKLLELEEVIGMTVVDPVRDEKGWAFREGPGHGKDPVNGFFHLSEAYKNSLPNYEGRVTVPVLWDKVDRVIVNNSEDDICRMMQEVFGSFGNTDIQLFPEELAGVHAALSQWIYEKVNNGVYLAGFATSQKPYERAVENLFIALDELERRLETSRYLFGSRIVEADWRLFCTLVRFDAVYYLHFKCNLRRIADYPNLQGYLRDLYQQPGISGTVNMDHIKRHYYMTHEEINPNGIVPLGPDLTFEFPHGRERVGEVDRVEAG